MVLKAVLLIVAMVALGLVACSRTGKPDKKKPNDDDIQKEKEEERMKPAAQL